MNIISVTRVLVPLTWLKVGCRRVSCLPTLWVRVACCVSDTTSVPHVQSSNYGCPSPAWRRGVFVSVILLNVNLLASVSSFDPRVQMSVVTFFNGPDGVMPEWIIFTKRLQPEYGLWNEVWNPTRVHWSRQPESLVAVWNYECVFFRIGIVHVRGRSHELLRTQTVKSQDTSQVESPLPRVQVQLCQQEPVIMECRPPGERIMFNHDWKMELVQVDSRHS